MRPATAASCRSVVKEVERHVRFARKSGGGEEGPGSGSEWKNGAKCPVINFFQLNSLVNKGSGHILQGAHLATVPQSYILLHPYYNVVSVLHVLVALYPLTDPTKSVESPPTPKTEVFSSKRVAISFFIIRCCILQRCARGLAAWRHRAKRNSKRKLAGAATKESISKNKDDPRTIRPRSVRAQLCPVRPQLSSRCFRTQTWHAQTNNPKPKWLPSQHCFHSKIICQHLSNDNKLGHLAINTLTTYLTLAFLPTGGIGARLISPGAPALLCSWVTTTATSPSPATSATTAPVGVAVAATVAAPAIIATTTATTAPATTAATAAAAPP
eukprot:scaffold18391_cov230-Isochrysis_galbana.AAC.1